MDTRRENTPDEGTLGLGEGEKEPIPNSLGRRGELKTFCGPTEGQVVGPSTSSLQTGPFSWPVGTLRRRECPLSVR
jgi:hypothetical protein